MLKAMQDMAAAFENDVTRDLIPYQGLSLSHPWAIPSARPTVSPRIWTAMSEDGMCFRQRIEVEHQGEALRYAG
jgi:hypothetical protein